MSDEKKEIESVICIHPKIGDVEFKPKSENLDFEFKSKDFDDKILNSVITIEFEVNGKKYSLTGKPQKT